MQQDSNIISMCNGHCEFGRSASLGRTDSSCESSVSAFTKMTELMAAVKAGDLKFVGTMFTALTEEEAAHAVRYRTPETKETLLFSACVKGHLEMARFLLGVARGQADLYTAWGAGPLHAAAERCHEDIVR